MDSIVMAFDRSFIFPMVAACFAGAVFDGFGLSTADAIVL
jgi:hypothetical protein